VYLERVAGLGAGSAADDVTDVKMINPMSSGFGEEESEESFDPNIESPKSIATD
jgi:hypothetical protein